MMGFSNNISFLFLKLCWIALLLIQQYAQAQDCDPDVPHFDVDLSSDPSAVFSSPPTYRNGNCCGTTNPDRCISFSLTLHEDAVGILFEVCEGAAPSGSLYYQIGCGPQIAVGEVLCLSGVGPHQLTFCKPGNNENVYCITSIAEPSAGPPQVASDGCTADIWAVGYDPTTIQWTSVYPGVQGEFDAQIECPTCIETIVTAPDNFPPYVDYMVCGQTIGGCAVTPDCDTVRVHFVTSLEVGIAPEEPAICFGSAGTSVTAVGSGGFPPYTFTWGNGTIGETTWIETPGTYSVQITDDSNCPPASYEFEVTEYAEVIEVNAGADQLICSESEDITLSGSFSGINNIVWEGGSGTFSPDRYAPNAIYTPTSTEFSDGQLGLILAAYPFGDCPPAFDTLLIQFSTFQGITNLVVSEISCFGDDDGSVSVDMSGTGTPFTIDWDTDELEGWIISDLPPGNHTAEITDAIGCTDLVSFELTEPDVLTLTLDQLTPVTCNGANDAGVELSANGGTPEYHFIWPNDESQSASADNLAPGLYTVVLEDEHDCTAEIEFEITEPDPLTISLEADTLICTSENVLLEAMASGGTGDLEFHWNEGLADAANHLVSPTELTEYSVFVSDENGCSTENVSVLVDVISMDPDLLSTDTGGPVCEGASSSVQAFYDGDHPPYYYSWSHGLPDGPGPHSVSPEETTTYIVTVSDGCGNSVISEMEIVIHSVPVVEILSTDVSCNGLEDGTAEVLITGGAPDYNYVWSNGNTTSSIENLAPGNYYVFAFDENQCGNFAAVTIAEPALVELQADADTLICLGTSATLNASASGGTGSFTYHWNESLTDQSSHLVNPDITTAYNVFASDENGCTSEIIEMTVEVITMDADLLTVTPGDPVCAGGSSEVVASYDGAHPPYSYIWSNGLPNGPGPHTVSPDETTTYAVTVSDFCGNSVTGETSIVIFPLPQLGLADLSDVSCSGGSDGSATVTVSSGTPEYSFHWSGSETHSANATNLAPGQHNVTVTDIHECPDSLGFYIAEPEPLNVSVLADTIVCPGETVSISATSGGGVGAHTYHWSHNLPSTADQQVELVENTVFEVYASDANGCTTAPESIEITVISMSTDLLEVTSGAGVCSGESTTVAAQYNGVHPPYTYEWSHNLPNGAGPHSVSPTDSTNYTVTVSDVCGNQVEQEVPVIIYPLPIVDLPSMMAEGCEDFSVLYTDSLNDPSTHSWVWTIDDDQIYSGQTLNYVFTEPGMHTVNLSVVSFQGCAAATTAPSFVMVFPSPVADFSADPSEAGIDDPEVHFTDLSTGDITSWNWSFDDGSTAVIQHPIHLYGDTGTYYVQLVVENAYECVNSIEKPVRIYPVYDIVIPNAFSPTSNNNGYYDPSNTDNDIFYPFAEYVEEFRMSIFNRWGELIFESTEFIKGWNGWYRDEPCAQDVYVYKIEFIFSDGVRETRVGDITLFR